jgi:hypothetical protein
MESLAKAIGHIIAVMIRKPAMAVGVVVAAERI